MLVAALAVAGCSAYAQTFTTPLFIPDTLPGPVYNLSEDMTMHQFFPGGAMVETYSFNNSGYLGPTLIWNKGTNITLNVTNNLGMNSTMHWHGAHVAPYNDGGPHDTILANTTWSPSFTVMDDATTMWYHPHLHMETMMQVQKGLAGLIIVRDPSDPFGNLLPHHYGVDDFPLILQDKDFEYDSISGDTVINTLCSTGPTIMVNGVPNPVLHVPAQMVRMRILDATSERAFNLAWSDSTVYNIIATDGGYTQAPIPCDTAMLHGCGERVEWVTDFTGRQGDTLYLNSNIEPIKNETDIPGTIQGSPGCYAIGVIDSTNYHIMKIVVDAPNANPGILPATFNPFVIPNPSLADRTRRKLLAAYQPDTNCMSVTGSGNNAPPFSIDSVNFNLAVLNDTVMLGATEVWKIVNHSGEAHPFHIHDIQFFVLNVNGNPVLPANLRGPKDVIFVRNNDSIEFITTFLDFGTLTLSTDSTYMYHCHILAHEDCGMMHQFVVQDTLGLTLSHIERPDRSGWKLFPNPTEGNLFITGECAGTSIIRLYDARGALVREKTLAPFSGTQQLLDEQLPPGLWHVEWIRSDGRDAKKIIIR